MIASAVKKIWFICLPSQRKDALLLLVMMLVAVVLETLGVGMVVPALVLMTNANLENQYPFINSAIIYMGNPTKEAIILVGISTLAFVYGMKALFLTFLAWKESKFVFSLQASLSQRLYSSYLFSPYYFHLQNNSAILIRNALTEVNQLTTATKSLMLIISETLVICGIGLLLILFEPVGALSVVFIFGLSSFLFYIFIRSRLIKWGEDRQFHEGKRIQSLQQGLGAIKDVLLIGCQEAFSKKYAEHSNLSAHASQRQMAITQFPRIWLEFLAICGLVGLVSIMLLRDSNVSHVLPVLGLFAAAAFRIMPSVGRLLTAIQNLKFNTPVVKNLSTEINNIKHEERYFKEECERLIFSEEISISNLCFKFSNQKNKSIDGFNLKLKHGETIGIAGQSGSGKSTLVNILLGLLSPHEGGVYVDGMDIQKNLRGWQKNIGYVPQQIYLIDDTIRRNIAFGVDDSDVDDASVMNAIELANLGSYISSLPNGLDALVGENGVKLSGGQRQRIGIARALYANPEILVLDEATSALDGITEKEIMDSINAMHGSKTIIIVAHRLDTLRVCDVVVIIEEGRVLETGSPGILFK